MADKTDITTEEGSNELIENALSKMDDSGTVALSTLEDVPEIESLLKAYPEEMRDKLMVSKEQLKRLVQHTKASTYGVSETLPLVCKSAECPFASVCMFEKTGIAPKGERCPPEIIFLNEMVPQLIKDMGVDLENYMEVRMVQEYAATLLDERRARMMISIEGDVKEVATSVVQATGTVLYAEQATPYVDIKERAVKRLTQLRKELLATKEQRAKYKLTDDRDPSTRAAEMREKFSKIQQAEEVEEQKLQEDLDNAFKKDNE
ncbi:hypothetical protein H8D85_00760 [bacterium]|nr:hypothetical protein [bacterium]